MLSVAWIGSVGLERSGWVLGSNIAALLRRHAPLHTKPDSRQVTLAVVAQVAHI